MFVDGNDQPSPSGCYSHDPLACHFRALHRRLWILNATLESLPRKIEDIAQAKGKDSYVMSAGIPSVSAETRPFADSTIEGWRARRRRAQLRSRAERADRRAARAIAEASDSFGTALEAVLLAAAARIKAEETMVGTDRQGDALRTGAIAP
jgi:hypothetical protein